MVKKNGRGKKEEDKIVAELPAMPPVETETQDDSHTPPIKSDLKELGEEDFIDGYDTPHTRDLLTSLLEPGSSTLNLLMKGNIPDIRWAIAIVRDIELCQEAHDKAGETEDLMLLAAICGVKAERANKVADTYALREKSGRNTSLTDWAKNKLGMSSPQE